MATTDEDLDRIAIVGMAGRFPGAPDVETFWHNLCDGADSITRFAGEDQTDVPGSDDPRYVPAKGVLDDADAFDAGFFGYTPREAELLDPQHRVFCETAWTALENAGCDPRTFAGRVGVFGGASLNTYLLYNVMTDESAFAASGAYQTLVASDKDFLATRVAYKLGLRGPAVTVQTACSTSLTAVHLACQSLLAGECDVALAGGVSVGVPLRGGYLYERGGVLSSDGSCRAFDADAGGTVPADGAGIVVLRRLGDAVADGDTVDAVICGTAVNNDGSTKAGYTAPSVDGQAEVITEALAVSDVDPSEVGYVEAHGTGTPLGDPIELAALTRAFREHTEAGGYCSIGSVKTNVGHLDAAAGVTGLIKAALALKHEEIPPSLHCEEPNPELGIDDSPFTVATDRRPWPRAEQVRHACVSSFGIGGTNVHAVLKEAAPPSVESAPDRAVRVVPLSAAAPAALADGAARLADYLDAHPEVPFGDVAYTVACRRSALDHRSAVVGRDRDDVVGALRRFAAASPSTPPSIDTAAAAFLFPGQGSQYAGMAREIYDQEPVFARQVDRCAELFAAQLDEDVREAVFAEPDEAADARLARTVTTQPALFTVEYALARLWQSWGVEPRAMVGHSVGEFVAACLAGVFSLEDAVRLVSERGRLMQAMPEGSMLAVSLSEKDVMEYLSDALSLAAVNSSEFTIASGPADAVAALRDRLLADGVGCRTVRTSHAFHSESMGEAAERFVDIVRTVSLSAPSVPFLSNVTGTWITPAQATDADYWGRQLRETVRFSAAVGELLADPGLVLVEVGPGDTLGTFVRGHEAWEERRTVVASLPHPRQRTGADEHLAGALGTAWSSGVAVDWEAFHGGRGRVVRLPGYAFQRARYWIEGGGAGERRAGRELRTPAGVTLSAPGWVRCPPMAARSDVRAATWVVLGADLPCGARLAETLDRQGATVVRGSTDRPVADVLAGLDTESADAVRIVELTGAALPGTRAGFESLVALARALDEIRLGVPVTVDVVTGNVHAVTGTESLDATAATTLGPATVMSQEIRGVRTRVLDVTDPGDPATAERLLAVLRADPDDEQLALRGRHWWTRRFDTVGTAEGVGSVQARLRDGGTYLVTGGLGGVGLALAEEIAERVERPALALLARSEFPDRQDWDTWVHTHGPDDATSRIIARLRGLLERGATVMTLQADVTDRAACTAAVERVRTEVGPLNGVIHAAGAPSGGLLTAATPERTEAVMAAKTTGTEVLIEAVDDGGPDFVLLCSSLTALLGGPGQSDYCGANNFLDAYAHGARSGMPVVSVGWDTWRGVGMAAGLSARLGGGTPTGHPLLHLLSDDGDTRTYASTFDMAGTWIVDDHRIMGHGLVPGTAYLELVRAAVAEEAGTRVVELRDIMFLLPVVVADGRERTVYTTLHRRGDELRFTVRSQAETGWQDHATGAVVFADRGDDVVRDLTRVTGECEATEVLETDEAIARKLQLGEFAHGPIDFYFGPRWKALRSMHIGPQRMLATLRLEDEFHDDLASYALHPALLDIAGAAARAHLPDTHHYLPFSYRSLRVEHPLTSTVYCAIRVDGSAAGETVTCDIEILDPDGRRLAEITEFAIKRINDVGDLLAQVEQSASAGEPAGSGGGAGTGETPGAATLRALGEGMSEREARDAFARILALEELPANVVVHRRELDELRATARSITPELLEREMGELPPSGATHPRPDLATPYAEPEGDDERAVAAVWGEVLGIEGIGRDDDFFELGGHSLAAVQIAGLLTQRFGIELPLQEFFADPTVAAATRLLVGAETTAADVPITRISRDEGPGEGEAELDAMSDEDVERRLRELLTAENEQGNREQA